MIRYKTEEEIKILQECGRINGKILQKVAKRVKPGVKTADLNMYAEKLIDEAEVTAAFLGYTPKGIKKPYPASLCVSVDEEIVHGIPTEEKNLKEGSIVTLDLGISLNSFITDHAITVPVGKVDELSMKLIAATKEALYAGIKAVKLGGHIGDVGASIMKVAKRTGFRVASDLSGHGVGYNVHEFPFVPNEGIEGDGPEIRKGLVIAIEPMFCEGSGDVLVLEDEYTYVTKDGKRAAHFEHTVAVTKNGVEILTG